MCENIFTNSENSNTYNLKWKPDSGSTQECFGGTSLSSILSNLDNESWSPDAKDKCFCTNKDSGSNHETYMYLRTVITGIKTIVFTSIPETNLTSLLVKYAVSNTPSPATSNTWITACSANCFLGTNDFTAAPLTIGALYWTFTTPYRLGVCEIWAYQYTNYIPGSLITAYLPGLDAKSVNFASYASNKNFIVLKDNSDSYFTAGGKHTCIRNQQSGTNYLAYIVVDFPQPMWIHEILQMSGKSDLVNIYLIDPSSSLMTQDASTLVATAKTLTNSDIVNYPGNGAKLISSTKNVMSIPCDATECRTWGATRMIFAPTPDKKDLFTCGMAVMAEPSPCTSLCYNPILMPLDSCPANLTVPQNSSNTSQNFLFPTDNSTLDLTCNPVSPICNQTFEHALVCIDCNTCQNTVNCSGTSCSTNFTTPTFNYLIQIPSTSPFSITVVDDQTQIINQFCKINANMTSQRNTSQTNQTSCGFMITVNPCPAPSEAQCNLTKLGILTTGNCPSDLTVPLGSTIQSNVIGFRFPDSISTQCFTATTPYVCDLPQNHTLQCVTCTDSSFVNCTSTYTIEPPFPYNVYLNATTNKYQVNITGNQSGVFQRCKINATMFDGLQMQQSSCTFKIVISCQTCNQTVFTQSYVPNFTLPIAIGASGQIRPFLAFNDTVSTCGTLCVNQKYSIYCLNFNDVNGTFQPISTILSGVTNTFNTASYPNFSLEIKTTKQSLHNQSFTCMLNVISLAVGSNATMNSTQNFTLSFSLCSNPAESCPLDTWDPAPSTWVKPTSINVFLDGMNKTATFNYSNVATKLSVTCSNITNYCGILQYYFQQVNDSLPVSIPGATIYPTVDDPLTKTLSITVSTLDIASVSTTRVKVFVILNQTSIWTGTPLNYSLSYFNITIANPCTSAVPCQYTNLINPGTIMSNLTIYLDNLPANQNQDFFNDTVSQICFNYTQICPKNYKLVYTSNGTQVPTDLAELISYTSTNLSVKASTFNTAYVGTWNVQVKCTATVTSAVGNSFYINVIACHTRSCKFTQLITPPAVLPTSFQIGVGNIPNSTTFSSPLNTVGNSCISNTSICGVPTYELLYALDNTSTSFTNFVTGSPNQQTAATSNISLNGVHTVYIKFVLNLTLLDPTYSPLNYSSPNYNITINYCSPLPCNYNYIYYPNVTNPIMPNSISVITNNTIAKSSFSDYSDDVSARCSPSTGYINMCGNKKYIIEYQNSSTTPTGTPLPFSTPVLYNTLTSLWEISINTGDNTLADTYKAVIHAQFEIPTVIIGNLSDNMTWPLTIILEVANPCDNLNCSRRALVMNRTGYLEPSDIIIDVSLTPNYTLFDSFNDTKTQSCFGKPGSDINGTIIASHPLPCCSPPLYKLVDAATGVNLNNFFGPIVQINWYQQAQFSQIFKIQVSTNFKSLVGFHIVKLDVRLLETDSPQYSQNFTITVFDPCNPPDCSNSSFNPAGQKPTNIQISIGDGYKASNQGTWNNSIDLKCVSTIPLCGKPQFELLLADGSPVPFSYFCVDMNGLVQVFVHITDESQKGQTFDVKLVGYGLNNITQTQFGQNGTSDIFKVIVGSNEVVNAYEQAALDKPIYTVWPQNQVFRISEDDNQTSIQQFAVEAFSKAGIKSINIDLSSAFTFLSYEIQNENVLFTLNYDKNSPIGTFKIKVTATDNNDLTVTNSFTVTFVILVKNEFKIKQKLQNFTNVPLIAVIESISNSGFMTISYNKRVVPLTNVTWISQTEFKMILQQNSDEQDQTEQFKYKVMRMTPDHIFVQLNFSRPLDVSQGISPDKVQVYMLSNLFMIEDTTEIYKDWIDGQILIDQTVDIKQIRNQENFGKFENITVYTPLKSEVPKQIGDSNEAANLLNNVNRFGQALQIVMWVPLVTHWIGFGQMEYTWVIFTNLQLISTITQFDLKLPVNLVTLTKSFACISNANFLPNTQLYLWYRRLFSPSDTPDLNIYGKPLEDRTGKITSYAEYVGVDDRRLDSTVLTEFEQSRFYGYCYTDRVFETAAQFFLSLFILFIIAVFGFILEKSFLTWLPLKIQEVFYYLRTRIFWCFPLRMFIQQYMIINFSAFINLKYQNKQDTLEHYVNRAISIVTLIFYSIGFVLCIFIFLKRCLNHLQTPELFTKFGTLWLSIEIEFKAAVPQVGIGLIRKFLMIAIAVCIPQNNLQFCSSLYVQEIYTVYLLLVKPMNRAGRNYIEYFNEISLLILIILLAPLTDYVTDPNIRLKVGWAIIYIIYFQLSVNVLFLILDMKKSCYKMFKTIRYKLYIAKLRREAIKHRQVVDELDRYKMTINYNQYKRRNPELEKQLSIIESEGSQISSLESVDLEKDLTKKKVLSISERQREFKELMARLEAENTKKHTFIVPIPLDADGKPLINEEFRRKIQHNNDWPVSPRLVNQLQNELSYDKKEIYNAKDWGWKVEINSSKASDWDALPKDYVDQSREFDDLSIQLDSKAELSLPKDTEIFKENEEIALDSNFLNNESLEKEIKIQTIRDSIKYEDSLNFDFK